MTLKKIHISARRCLKKIIKNVQFNNELTANKEKFKKKQTL